MRPILASLGCTLAESPVWDERLERLFWVDITPGQLHSFTPATGLHESWDFHEKISCIGLCENTCLLVAGISGIWKFSPDDGKKVLWMRFPAQPVGMRPNDGKVGPDGAFWVGTMQDQNSRGPLGKLFRFTAEGNVQCILHGLVTPNGLAWSPDGEYLYLAETRSLTVTRWSFDLSTGRIHSPILFIRLSTSQGKPDGACIDEHGNYWVCGIYSGNVYVYSQDGILLDYVSVGSRMVTMPCFGGHALNTLYVTSLTDKDGLPGTVSQAVLSGVRGRISYRMSVL